MNIAYKNATEAFEDLYNFIIGQGVKTNIGAKAVYNVGFYIKGIGDEAFHKTYVKLKQAEDEQSNKGDNKEQSAETKQR